MNKCYRLLFLTVILLSTSLLLSSCSSLCMPEDGVWYCEELKLTLYFGAKYKTGIKSNAEFDAAEESLPVSCWYERQSNYFEIVNQTPGSSNECLFAGSCVSLSEDRLCVVGESDEHNGKEYWFVRID